jgi:hypothetical protein
MTHSHLVSRRTALKVGAGLAAMPLVHRRTARAANQKTFEMAITEMGLYIAYDLSRPPV